MAKCQMAKCQMAKCQTSCAHVKIHACQKIAVHIPLQFRIRVCRFLRCPHRRVCRAAGNVYAAAFRAYRSVERDCGGNELFVRLASLGDRICHMLFFVCHNGRRRISGINVARCLKGDVVFIGTVYVFSVFARLAFAFFDFFAGFGIFRAGCLIGADRFAVGVEFHRVSVTAHDPVGAGYRVDRVGIVNRIQGVISSHSADRKTCLLYTSPSPRDM